jgi:putative ABC transport system permease protein
MRTWELFCQALAGAARARLRSALTAIGVAIGCGALVSMIAFALGLQRQIEAPLKRLGMLNDIHVSPRDTRRGADRDDDGNGGDRKPSASTSDAKPALPNPLDGPAVERIRKLPGVRYAYPDMTLHDVGLAHGAKQTQSFAMALPREIGMIDQFNEMLVAGHFFSLDDVPQVVLADNLLDDLGFDSAADAVDATITISTSGLANAEGAGEFRFENKTVPVKVVGVIQPPQFSPRSMGGGVLMPVDLLEQLPGLVESQLWRMRRGGTSVLDSYASVTVRADNPAAVPRLVKAIEDQGFETQTVLSRLEDMRVAFLFIEGLLTAVGSVALIIAGLGIANTLLMTVLERYEEIGLYKAIGATDGDVRLMFLAEAAVLGLVGSLAGLALAAVVCWGLQWGVNAYLAREGVTRAVDVFYFPWWLLASAVAVATLMSVASGLYPASRAARVDPIKALRRS